MSAAAGVSKKALWISIISLILSMVVHWISTTEYYQLQIGTVASDSLCNINQTFNCNAAILSNFSSIMGVPLALLGAVTNGALLCLILFAFFGLSQDPIRVFRYSFWVSSFILLMSVIMGVIATTQLSSICPLCLAAYVLSLITWLALFFGIKPNPFGLLKEDLKGLLITHRAVLGVLTLIPLLSFLIHFTKMKESGQRNLDKYAAQFISQWKASKSYDFSLSPALSKGPKEAKMIISEFADFRCGHCKTAASSIKVFLETHPDVQMNFYAFPLDGDCNKAITRADGISCRLAKSVHCAEKLNAGSGWKLHYEIFERQQHFSSFHRVSELDEELKKQASPYIKNFEDLTKCMDSEETQKEIMAQAQLGEDSGVEGTPTIYVNNRKLQYGQNIQVLKRVYEEITSR